MTMLLTRPAWDMVQLAVNVRKDKEIAGFGRCKFDPETQQFVIDDILIPPQIFGGAHAEFDVGRGDLDWYLAQVLAKGDQPEDWRLWWHSHASMSTSPSSVDHATLKMLSGVWNGWATGIVFNTRKEATGWLAYRASYKSPFGDTMVEQTIEETIKVTYEMGPQETAVDAINERIKLMRARFNARITVLEEEAKAIKVADYVAPDELVLRVASWMEQVKESYGAAASTKYPSGGGMGSIRQVPLANAQSPADRRTGQRIDYSGAKHPSGRKWVADMSDEEFHQFVTSPAYQRERKEYSKRNQVKDLETAGALMIGAEFDATDTFPDVPLLPVGGVDFEQQEFN